MLSDAEQQKLIQKFGYHPPDPHATTPEVATVGAATSNGATTSYASTGADTTAGGIHAKGKSATPQHKVMHQVLKGRSSDPGEPRRLARDLTQELQAHPSAAPPETTMDDFWTRMEQMTTRQSHAI